MCGVLIAEAACVAINNTPATIGAVVFLFMFEACFTSGRLSSRVRWCSPPNRTTLGWMATVWTYPPDILLLKIGAKGAALAAAADFLGNFIVVEITPTGLQNIVYKLYIVFAVLNITNAAIVWA